MIYLPHSSLLIVEPERVCVWTFEETDTGSQVCLAPSVPLEADQYLWTDNEKKKEGDVSYNGSSSPLPLEEQLFPVSEQEDWPRPPESI